MSKFEFLKFLGRGRREAIPVLDNTAQIKKISKKELLIWTKGGGSSEDKRRRHKEVAEELLPLINLELVQDPSFYQKLSPKIHLGALKLLSEFIPDEHSEELESSTTSKVIVGYLNGFVDNRDILPSEQDVFGRSMNLVDRDSAVSLLRRESNMPKYFLDQIFGNNVGLSPERDRLAVNSLVQYAPALNIAEEQRKQKKL